MARFVIVLSLISAIFAVDIRRRCLLYGDKCVSHCPRNMHAYHTRCDGGTKSQRTCDSPLVYVLGYTCGWSRCDCNGDLMLDEQTGFCVKEQDCLMYPSKTPKLPSATERRRSGRRKYHLSKRIKINDDELNELS